MAGMVVKSLIHFFVHGILVQNRIAAILLDPARLISQVSRRFPGFGCQKQKAGPKRKTGRPHGPV